MNIFNKDGETRFTEYGRVIHNGLSQINVGTFRLRARFQGDILKGLKETLDELNTVLSEKYLENQEFVDFMPKYLFQRVEQTPAQKQQHQQFESMFAMRLEELALTEKDIWDQLQKNPGLQVQLYTDITKYTLTGLDVNPDEEYNDWVQSKMTEIWQRKPDEFPEQGRAV